jgi:PAS domain S-box-containing protein
MMNFEEMTREQLIALLTARADAPAPATALGALAADSTPVLKWICDADSLACLDVNDAALSCFGYTRAQFLALPLSRAPGQAAVPPGVSLSSTYPRPDIYQFDGGAGDGAAVCLQLCHVAIVHSGRAALLMLGSDISRHLRTEADLRCIESWLHHSQAYAQFGIWDWDIGSGATRFSEHLAPLFGYREHRPETTRASLLEAVHPEDRQQVLAAVHDWTSASAQAAPGSDGFDIEYRIVRPDGELRWMHERGGIQRALPGTAPRVLGVVQDITRQKQSEQALRESEQHFRLFAENIREMIWVASPALDKLFYVSPACSDILGISADELHKGKLHWKQIVCFDDHPLMTAALARQERGEVAEVEARIVRPDGKVRWIRVRSFPVRNGHGERMASGIAEDVTDRKQLEQERIVQMTQQRGTLVREVHHRIKNNLQGVAGLLRQQAYAHPELGPIIDQAIAQVRTVAVIHGLQGQAMDNEIVLCEMVPSIARAVATLHARTTIEVDVQVPQRIRVSEQESVPIALILNELIMNAAKHAVCAVAPARVDVSVRWDGQLQLARIRIVNPGSLPPGFAFGDGRGTGTGHELVRSLLPPSGGSLAFVERDGQVETVLELSAPSIYNGDVRIGSADL